MDDIAEIAAFRGARRGLAGRVPAELGDQIRRVGRRRAIGHMNMFEQRSPHLFCSVGIIPARFRKCPPTMLNEA